MGAARGQLEARDLGRLLSSPANVMRWHLGGRRERYAREIANDSTHFALLQYR